MKNLTASDRSALIRLAASLPVGDENRRTILAGLAKTVGLVDQSLALRKRASLRWNLLEGPSLEKVEKMFPMYEGGHWYALADKVRGKTVFARDHGMWTLYVVGNDGYAWSMKLPGSGAISKDDVSNLVDSARKGDASDYPRAGIYRNIKVFDGGI